LAIPRHSEAKERAEREAKEEEKRQNEIRKNARRNFTKACKRHGIYDPEVWPGVHTRAPPLTLPA
jgi:hypothetical protein